MHCIMIFMLAVRKQSSGLKMCVLKRERYCGEIIIGVIRLEKELDIHLAFK